MRVLGYLPTIYLEIFKIMYFENVLSNFYSLFQGYMMGPHDIQLMLREAIEEWGCTGDIWNAI